jgi:hypothetical protein
MKEPRAILTPALADEYDREGVVRVPGAIPTRDVAALAATLWRKLDARPRREARPSQLSSRTGEFDAMASPTVRALLDEVLPGWKEPDRWGLPLVSFHTGEAEWDVPHAQWHVDLGAHPGEYPIARIFAVLEPSRPRGGGTGYVAGSHRLIEALATRAGRPLRSAEVKRLLAERSPWFAALFSAQPREDRVRRFVEEGAEVDGVAVQVREMLGEPGDVILMHPLMLHATMPNVRDTPRMMLGQFVYGRS